MKENWYWRRFLSVITAILILTVLLGIRFRPTNANDGGEGEEGKGIYTYYFPWAGNGLSDSPPQNPVGPIGGTFTAVVVDPNDDRIVYGGSYQTGVYKSYDQGAHWYSKSNGLQNLKIQSLAAHPSLSTTIYAGTYGGGLFFSMDYGNSWSARNGSLLNNHIIYDIEIDKNNPDVIFTVSRIKGSLVGYVSKSTDGGKTWITIFKGDIFNTPDYFYDIDIHPGNSSLVYLAAHEHGFYRSHDGGVSFYPILNGVYDYSARGFALDPSIPDLVYGAVWKGGGVYRSWNNGNTWENKKTGLPQDVRITKIFSDPYGSGQRNVFLTTQSHGLFSSEDYGGYWRGRGLNGKHLNDIAISNSNPQTWYIATQYEGIVRSKNEGASWETIMKDLRLYAITGMTSIETSPDDLFISIYGKGVFQVSSKDELWTDFNSGLDDVEILGLYGENGTLWAWSQTGLWQWDHSGWEKLSLPETHFLDENLFLNWAAERSGSSIETLIENRKEEEDIQKDSLNARSLYPTSLVIDGKKLIIGTVSGLWEQTAKGWQRSGLDAWMIYHMALDQESGDLWVSACNQTNYCAIFRKHENNWQNLSAGLYGGRVNQVLLHQKDWYVASDSGIYKWRSETSSWLLVGGGGEPFYSIHQNPVNHDQLIAGGKGRLLISGDGGNSWQTIGLNETWSYQTIAFDPNDSSIVYLGTLEKGAYRVELPEN